MTEGRMMQARFNGRDYSIPEIWVAGFCSPGPAGHGRTIADAIAWWAWQEELKDREEATAK